MKNLGIAGFLELAITLLDTIGELVKLYALADLAFVGGSLVPHGGQNLLEPAYYGAPLCFGEHMENFAELADRFIGTGAARIVRGQEDLKELFLIIEPKNRRVGFLLRSSEYT
jgi:3-deoxy-D-manno-octulosonic-acid transferase